MKKDWLQGNHKRKLKTGTFIKRCANCNYQYHSEVKISKRVDSNDYDICPYCSACNGVSNELLFINTRYI